MSSPMTINRSASSTSLSSTMSIGASPASPKYIPVHRRTPSNASVASSSRPSSPMEVELASPSEISSAAPGVYSFDALLALRPMADDSIKNVLRETCPEVLMNHRQKKSIQYLNNHPQARSKTQNHKQNQPDVSLPQGKAVGAMPSAFTSSTRQQRSLPRRNRSGRGPERRRSILQDTWQGMRVTARQPLMVL